MESEIQFGQVEHSQPKSGLRPDKDKHFVVSACGDIHDSDLPIFIDMDVQRDMEAHARENTRVELGGVMLGQQYVDDQGKPFVVITDSLRAQHYEATKGSFKFTHETWNQITRERNQFRSDLELVGWYHTHPGWGVFLSGMDLFICNNFFNRPLDVALVIDPCAGERGWFQSSESEDGKTRQTDGFFLMTNRHRQAELNYFSQEFNNQRSTIQDPRFRQVSYFDQQVEQGDEMVNIIDSRPPIFELAIVSMIFFQMLVAGILGWRMLGTNDDTIVSQVDSRVAAIESKIETNQDRRDASMREQVFSEILDKIVTEDTGNSGLVDQYAEMATQNRMLTENLEGQLARVHRAANEKNELTYQLSNERVRAEKLGGELRDAQQTIVSVRDQNEELSSRLTDGNTDADVANVIPQWMLYTLGGLGLFALGVVGGSFARGFGRDVVQDDTVNNQLESPGDGQSSVVFENQGPDEQVADLDTDSSRQVLS